MKKINKKQKGITLVALIITIIIMLILVGVSVSVAINGGLFRTAKQAVIGTEKQIIYDQILSSIQFTDIGEIDIDSTYEKAKAILEPQVKSVSDIIEGVFDVEGGNGTYTYTITEDEIIMGLEEDDVIVSPAINDFEIEVTYNSSAGTLTIVPTDSNVPTISDFSTYQAQSRTLQIDGEPVENGVTWTGNTATYIVPDNNTSSIAEIQVILDSYMGAGRITTTE